MFLPRNSGVCAACGKSLVCTYSKDKGRPVTSCEDFDGYEMSGPASGVISPLAHSWIVSEEETFSGGDGLCGTCRNQSECRQTDKTDCSNYR